MYFGIDISEAMLRTSAIPARQQAQLRVESLSMVGHHQLTYDVVLALGLTTYYPAIDLPSFYKAVHAVMAPNGAAIISYTHARSYDFRLRAIIHSLLGKWLPNRRSLGRNFPIYASSPKEEQTNFPPELVLHSTHWLPPYIPILTNLFPRFSVFLSKQFHFLGPKWRGDFLLVIKNVDSKQKR